MCTTIRCAAAALIAVAISPAQNPLTPTLLADINREPSTVINSSSPGRLAESAGLLYLRIRTDTLGAETWVSDGTVAGTRLLADLAAGSAWANPWEAVTLPNGVVLIGSGSDDWGAELFAAGPGIQGIQLVKDIAPGPNASSGPDRFTVWNGEAWFYANDLVHGDDLWRSDGTPAGTRLGEDVVPGPVGPSNGTNEMTVAGGKLYFTSTYPTGLWCKATPTTPSVELRRFGSPTSTSGHVDMAEVGGALVFVAQSANEGTELWHTDGTLAGTKLLVDIQPGAASSFPVLSHSDGSRLWFSAAAGSSGAELWLTDGTAAGTRMVADINPQGSSYPSLVFPWRTGVLLRASDGATGNELWFSDGTAAGTRRVADIRTGFGGSDPGPFFAHLGFAYSRADDGIHGIELWRTDGTTAGTTLVADVRPGPDWSFPIVIGSTAAGLFLAADDGVRGYEPWLTDGTPAGTRILANLNPDPQSVGSSPRFGVRFHDRFAFLAVTAAEGFELWKTDGTTAGTQLVADLRPGPAGSGPVLLGELGGELLISPTTMPTGTELWATDLTAAGTRRVRLFAHGYSARPIQSAGLLNGLVYFGADGGSGSTMWRTDGTTSGTVPVVGFPAFRTFSIVSRAIPGKLVLIAYDNVHGNEPWISDGTGPGTTLLKDIEPGASNSSPGAIVELASRLVFAATTSAEGTELWVTDGSPAGTRLLRDIGPGPDSGVDGYVPPIVLGSQLVFPANDGVHGSELWVSDGTTAGTTLLVDLEPGPTSSRPSRLVRAGRVVFFWRINSSAGGRVELWKTDGTVAGTVLVDDRPGPGLTFAGNLLTAAGSGEHIAFRQDDAVHGDELWVSDGTASGTRLLADSAPGLRSGYPQWCVTFGDRLLFIADDGLSGREPHSVPLSSLGAWVAEPFGRGCGARIAAAGSARLGRTLDVDLRSSDPSTPAVLFFGTDSAFVELLPDCVLHLAVPRSVAAITTDPTGFGRVSIPVPNIPALLGAGASFQYAALAAGGPLFGVLELSNGLEVVVGS